MAWFSNGRGGGALMWSLLVPGRTNEIIQYYQKFKADCDLLHWIKLCRKIPDNKLRASKPKAMHLFLLKPAPFMTSVDASSALFVRLTAILTEEYSRASWSYSQDVYLSVRLPHHYGTTMAPQAKQCVPAQFCLAPQSKAIWIPAQNQLSVNFYTSICWLYKPMCVPLTLLNDVINHQILKEYDEA